jgi:hypothetical protein
MGHPPWWVIWSCSCGKVEFLVTPAVAGAKAHRFSTRCGATKSRALIQSMSFSAGCSARWFEVKAKNPLVVWAIRRKGFAQLA